VHADDIGKATGRFGILILPNVAALSDAQAKAVEVFAGEGGSVLATGETSRFSLYGDERKDFALADLFGVHRDKGSHGGTGMPDTSHDVHSRHTYLRLSPEQRAQVDGPFDSTAPIEVGIRHPILAGLEATDTIPFGGYLPVVSVDDDVQVLATFVPDFPIFPPELAWMSVPYTSLPAITVRESASGAKLVWFVADIDRCYTRDESFEHALLIANAVRWALAGRHCVSLEGGRGFVSVSLYKQEGRQILHLNNRVITAHTPGRQTELVPTGAVTVRLAVQAGTIAPAEVDLRVAGGRVPASVVGGQLEFEVAQVLDHEVVVIAWSA
jgi:hypothetical protein